VGRCAKTNFYERFGNPLRLAVEHVSFDKDPLGSAHRREKILKAYDSLLRDILKREPTINELLGSTRICEANAGVRTLAVQATTA
jgi:hypothetical protein